MEQEYGKLEGFSIPSAKMNPGTPSNDDNQFDSAGMEGGEEFHDLTHYDDAYCHHKDQLWDYCHLKNCDLPLYSSTDKGPSHALRFKAKVTVDGNRFESPGFSRTLDEAEKAAAKVATKSLSADGFQKENPRFYKNLLQELSQREHFSVPVYKTVKSGPPHMPTFFSSVKVEGEAFYGNAGKSKKEAELKAAKVAYALLKERATRKKRGSASSKPVGDKTFKSTCGSHFTMADDLQGNLKEKGQLLSSTIVVHKGYSTNDELEKGSLLNPKEHKAVEARSYLLGGKVRVYTYHPETAFPNGITVLPISDDKWVAVSLELPNEQDY